MGRGGDGPVGDWEIHDCPLLTPTRRLLTPRLTPAGTQVHERQEAAFEEDDADEDGG